jgi:chorismate dehydratase
MLLGPDPQADVALVSLVDAARSPEPLAILPCGMIGCDGPTLTVRLYSRVPLHAITTLHADTDSHTSVILARLLLRTLHSTDPAIVPFDARERAPSPAPAPDEAWPDSVLLIGDKVVAGSPPAVRYPYQLDLGQAWHEHTALPFVYAAWMARADRAADPDTAPTIRAAADLLDRQRRRNAMRIDRVAADAAARHRWPADLARTYVGSLLRYDLDARARAGAERFLADAAAIGLIPPHTPTFLTQ